MEGNVITFISAHEELAKDLADELKCVKKNHERRITHLEGTFEVIVLVMIY